MAHTLILGAGFGGITVATELRRRLGDDHDITLVPRNEYFAMGLRKAWAVVDIGTCEEGSSQRRLLENHGIELVRREIRTIHPVGRCVGTDQGELEADYLVVALGAGLTRPLNNESSMRGRIGPSDRARENTEPEMDTTNSGESGP